MNTKPGPEIEQIIADWIIDKFGMEVKIRRGTVHDPLLVWDHYIIAIVSKNQVESGSWVRPRDLHQIAIGDPKLFEKLEALIRIRFDEISKDCYAGQLSQPS